MDLGDLCKKPARFRRRSSERKTQCLDRHRRSLEGEILESVRETTISCVMSPDLNIRGMARDIVSIIKSEDKEKIKLLQEEADKYSTLLDGTGRNLTLFMKKMYMVELKGRKAEIERISNNGNVKKFLKDTTKIVENHASLDRDKEKSKRRFLVSMFLEIASNFCGVSISYVESRSKIMCCPECESVEIETTDSGSYLCTECHNEWPIIVKYGSVSVEEDKHKSSGMYETRRNFEKSLKKFEGLHSNIIDKEKLYEQLDEYFYKLTGKTRAEIIKVIEQTRSKNGNSRDHGERQDRQDRRRRRNGERCIQFTKQTMIEALSETGYSEYYRDVNTILSEYWRWGCRDLDEYKQMIMESYDQYVKEFNKLFKNNPLPTNDFFLYVLLNKAKIEKREPLVSKREFKIIKTHTILNGHISRTAAICESLSRTDSRWNFFSKIPWN